MADSPVAADLRFVLRCPELVPTERASIETALAELDRLATERADPEQWASLFLDHPDDAFRQRCMYVIGEGWHEKELDRVRTERDRLAAVERELGEARALLGECEQLISDACPLGWAAADSIENMQHASDYEKDAEKLLARIRGGDGG